MTVKITQEECIGCGVCGHVCGEVFLLDESLGKSKVIKPEGAACVKEAVESCPVGCITN